MQKELIIRKIAFNLAWVSWGLLLVVGFIGQQASNPQAAIPFFSLVQGLLLNIFILSTYFYARKKITLKGKDFSSLLTEVFWLALVTTALSMLLSGLMGLAAHHIDLPNPLIRSFFFYFEFGLFIVFLITAFATWRKMILFERSRFTYYAWTGFEYFLLASLLLHFFRLGKLDVIFSVQFGFFLVWILVLSFNVRWVPQLNFNQKLYGILRLFIVFFCLVYFFLSITNYFRNEPLLLEDVSKNLYATVLFAFVVIYSMVSLLVILFNLPTSSAFERKFRELDVYQRMSDRILEGKNERDVFRILFNSALRSVKADAGWLEASGGDISFNENLSLAEMQESGRLIREQGFDHTRPQSFNLNRFRLSGQYPYRSVLAFPLFAGSHLEGTMVLMKKLPTAFDRNMLATINTFVAQASIAVQNHRLLHQALENERFKNEINIAKGVQERLLPIISAQSEDFDLFAYAKSAKEVGGDYYDYHKISEKKYGVIIADVSGKSIPAAFNMAQMKGIFQCLVRLNLNPDQFMAYANAALSSCLEKAAFITAAYFFIDTAYKKVYYCRAGHCPAIYYSAATGQTTLLDSKGLGLGIIRDSRFSDFVEVSIFDYHPGDLLLLYTDGLVEAHNEQRSEQYGYERLRAFIAAHSEMPLHQLTAEVVESIYQFTGADEMEDDFTLLTIRF